MMLVLQGTARPLGSSRKSGIIALYGRSKMPKELKFHKFIKPYVVDAGEGFRLKDHDPGDIHG